MDVQSWDVRPGTDTKWKAWACSGSYVLFLAHTLYKVTSLIHTLAFGRSDVPLHQLMIHSHVVSGATMVAYWYYLLYIRHAHVNAAFARITLIGDGDSMASNVGTTVAEVKEGGGQRLWERPLQDLIALLMPYMTPVVAVMIGACILYDPTMNMLLYSALPGSHQNWLTFGICFLEEMRFIGLCVGISVLTLQRQIIAFDFITTRLRVVLAGKT